MTIYSESVKKAGLDIKKVTSIAKRLSKAAKEAEQMNIIVFGGTGNGTLRFNDHPDDYDSRLLILAELDGNFDGGDGASIEDDDGFLRGE